jgi:hypothetical protein
MWSAGMSKHTAPKPDTALQEVLRPGQSVWAVIKAVTFDHAMPPP